VTGPANYFKTVSLPPCQGIAPIELGEPFAAVGTTAFTTKNGQTAGIGDRHRLPQFETGEAQTAVSRLLTTPRTDSKIRGFPNGDLAGGGLFESE
jgi:hypothetical protein